MYDWLCSFYIIIMMKKIEAGYMRQSHSLSIEYIKFRTCVEISAKYCGCALSSSINFDTLTANFKHVDVFFSIVSNWYAFKLRKHIFLGMEQWKTRITKCSPTFNHMSLMRIYINSGFLSLDTRWNVYIIFYPNFITECRMRTKRSGKKWKPNMPERKIDW